MPENSVERKVRLRDRPTIRALHHAQITIPSGSEERARDFYCRVLSLEEVEKPASLAGRGGFWLRVGDRQVHVGTERGVDRAATKAHLAYEVTGLGLWRDRLAEEGIEVFESVPILGYERFEFRDPFGNRVEMIEHTGDTP
jgi:catechol 2,3-dioxygenase-like lactoylglutathione lyase family enzyme